MLSDRVTRFGDLAPFRHFLKELGSFLKTYEPKIFGSFGAQFWMRVKILHFYAVRSQQRMTVSFTFFGKVLNFGSSLRAQICNNLIMLSASMPTKAPKAPNISKNNADFRMAIIEFYMATLSN